MQFLTMGRVAFEIVGLLNSEGLLLLQALATLPYCHYNALTGCI